MNKVILVGRLARDPEVRYTQSGKANATFTLAVNRYGILYQS
jgi:single-strand DNA-binding protein